MRTSVVMFLFAIIDQTLASYLHYRHRQYIAEALFIACDDHIDANDKNSKANWIILIDTLIMLTDRRFEAEAIVAFLLNHAINCNLLSYHMMRHKYVGEVSKIVDQLIYVESIILGNEDDTKESLYNRMLFKQNNHISIIIKILERVVLMKHITSFYGLKLSRAASKATLETYSPLAHRLGMTELKQKLEQKAFKILHPYRHNVIKNAISRIRQDKSFIFDKVFAMLNKHLKETIKSTSKIIGRTKTPYSVYNKLKQEKLSIDKINDIYAYTILAHDKTECYIILGIIHSLFQPVHHLFKDFIAAPKENGYQSLHTTLLGPYETLIEVQIKTEEMHQVSKHGLSAHWLYKDKKMNNSTPNTDNNSKVSRFSLIDKNVNKSEKLLTVSASLTESLAYEIKVMTPLGTSMKMPINSTCLDLAYAIHSDIGNSCVAAYVNKRRVPLKYRLHNGDTVEIITSIEAVPRHEWLEFVTTERAISHITASLKKSVM